MELFELKEENRVLTIIMQSPDNNLMTDDFFQQYKTVMQKVEDDVSKGRINGIIICGKGRHFSTGADVQSLTERSVNEVMNMKSEYDFPDTHIRQKHTFTFLYNLPVPVISAISGFCIGSGSEIAVNSHIRVCDKTAHIGQPESTFGIISALGGITRTASVCGISSAFEIAMSGKLLSARQAYEIGWADIVTEKKQSLLTAKKLMDFILLQQETYCRENVHFYVSHFLQEV